MANHTKTTTLTDLQQKILANDLYTEADNSGLDAWIDNAVTGKITTAGNVCSLNGLLSL